ncbi:MAG: TonB-dependent receptor, partial [Bdellovibrionales bacterium]
RVAGFRCLSVGRAFNQTIEPTQVAGFNQFFDDIDGTYSWRFGAGLDHRFSSNIATGIEYSERKLYIPGYLDSVDRSEQLGRAYLNFTPLSYVALGAEYYFERINQPGRPISGDNALSGGLFDIVETHRVPLSLSLFHPSGFSFKIKNSFVHQSGVFQNQNTLKSFSDKSDFFVVDLNLSYRLPKRYGMLTLGVNNLFNDKLAYQNTNINEPIFAPGRTLFSRFTLAY